MDYVREALMRQQTALARMLLGAAEVPGEAEARSGAEMSRSAFGEAQQADGEGHVPELSDAADAPGALLWTEALQRRQAAQRRAEAVREVRMLDLAASAAAAAAARRPLSGGAEAVFGGDADFPEEVPGWERRRWSRLPEAAGQAAAPEGEALSVLPAVPGLRGETPGEAARSVVELVRPQAAAQPDAGALSRVFQRDARRYDGGFELY